METKVYATTKTKRPSLMSEVVEAFDLEWKLFFTFRDFIKKPEHVISTYKEGKKDYINPIKLIVLSGAAYWIITSYFIDWEVVALSMGESYGELVKSFLLFIDDDPSRVETLNALVGKIKVIAADVFQLLMQYLGVYVTIVAMAFSTVLYTFTRKHGTSYREIVGFQCYRSSFFIVFLLLLLPLGYLNYWIPIGLLVIINVYLEHINRSNKFSIFPYLKVPKKQGRKYLFKSMMVLLLIVILISMVAGYNIANFLLK